MLVPWPEQNISMVTGKQGSCLIRLAVYHSRIATLCFLCYWRIATNQKNSS